MDDQAAIVAEILKSPNDPFPWTVLHDWLAQYGLAQPWQLERLRWMIGRLPIKNVGDNPDDPTASALSLQEGESLPGYILIQTATLPEGYQPRIGRDRVTFLPRPGETRIPKVHQWAVLYRETAGFDRLLVAEGQGFRTLVSLIPIVIGHYCHLTLSE